MIRRFINWHRLQSGGSTRWWFWRWSIHVSIRRESISKGFFRPKGDEENRDYGWYATRTTKPRP